MTIPRSGQRQTQFENRDQQRGAYRLTIKHWHRSPPEIGFATAFKSIRDLQM
jgi:hypothetical protein